LSAGAGTVPAMTAAAEQEHRYADLEIFRLLAALGEVLELAAAEQARQSSSSTDEWSGRAEQATRTTRRWRPADLRPAGTGRRRPRRP
jgi:hypothetical protein